MRDGLGDMESYYYPPGPFALKRGAGTTPSERTLARRAEQTFLSLWSYPNVWREQRASGMGRGSGKELCDLLVVFDNHVIVFSDKDIEYRQDGDPQVAWSRWYRKSISKSADQVFGAERWIRTFPDKIFLDQYCTQNLPVTLPAPGKLVMHRVVVARGAGKACREYFGGGSGSLMIVPTIKGDGHMLPQQRVGSDDKSSTVFQASVLPFHVGLVSPEQGFVHVLDDTTLDILLSTLDTVADLARYLTAKEDFISSGRLITAAGEEEILAQYLKYTGDDGEHVFWLPDNAAAIAVCQGVWSDFCRNPQRIAQIRANRVSYLWDELIERFSFHALNDSQHFATERGAHHVEPALRLLAKEPRTRRRMLAEATLGVAERAKTSTNLLEARVVEPSRDGEPFYVILALRRPVHSSYEEYREKRRAFLDSYVRVVKAIRPQALDIVGIAFGYPDSEQGGSSEDLLCLDARQWTDEAQREAIEIQERFGFLKSVRRLAGVVKEYPDEVVAQKGKDRNQPCACGSGKKFKKCHGA